MCCSFDIPIARKISMPTKWLPFMGSIEPGALIFGCFRATQHPLSGARSRSVPPAFQGVPRAHAKTRNPLDVFRSSPSADCLGYLRQRYNVESKLISCGFGFQFVESIGEILLAEPGTDPFCSALRPYLLPLELSQG